MKEDLALRTEIMEAEARVQVITLEDHSNVDGEGGTQYPDRPHSSAASNGALRCQSRVDVEECPTSQRNGQSKAPVAGPLVVPGVADYS